MLAVLSALPLAVALLGASKPCPRNCQCYDSDLVDCRARGLAHVPHSLPHGTWLLDLGLNSLTELRSHSFSGLWSLRVLVLSDSGIQLLQPQALFFLSFLEKLDLSHNKLPALPSDFSHSLSSLRELHLDHNQLQHLGSSSLERLENLEKLDLSHNRIQSIELGALRGLSRLRHLYLQANQLAALQEGTLTRLQGLEVLLLGQNHISKIETEALAPLHSLSLLGLERNRLEHLKFKSLLNLRAPSTHLQLSANPWTCDCDLHRVFSKVLRVRRLHVDDYENITCRAPLQLAGAHLAWVDGQLCMAETATVLVITVTVLVTVIAAIVMAERNRKKN
ncbi:hypothetical protein ANANG_G00043060 [Anguilla anguilla]|uniref:LRRNT domain-containing protein n=1 Tax=Anguilla anguilla TaxID=7936 RepID=A0A9D3MX30_ANGAN|nr:hypothetical protein ANANG_G00043060 [Anguilla anguilla]